jgi:hypothetical protein
MYMLKYVSLIHILNKPLELVPSSVNALCTMLHYRLGRMEGRTLGTIKTDNYIIHRIIK